MKHECSKNLFKGFFSNIVLIPRPGHIELNMGRLLLKFLWTLFLLNLVKKHGFQTGKAQLVVKNSIDHHRTHQILSCSLLALPAELLLPYVCECLQKQVLPMNEGYQKWVTNTCNQQYLFVYHITFSYLLAFHLHTEATQKNDSLRMLAARIQFAPLFYSFKHLKYQKLHLQDICQRAQMPDMLKYYVESHESFSVSGVNNRRQGYFIQEENSKLIKSFLPPGMPSAETWYRVHRKATSPKEIKQSVCDAAGVKKFSTKDI